MEVFVGGAENPRRPRMLYFEGGRRVFMRSPNPHCVVHRSRVPPDVVVSFIFLHHIST